MGDVIEIQALYYVLFNDKGCPQGKEDKKVLYLKFFEDAKQTPPRDRSASSIHGKCWRELAKLKKESIGTPFGAKDELKQQGDDKLENEIEALVPDQQGGVIKKGASVKEKNEEKEDDAIMFAAEDIKGNKVIVSLSRASKHFEVFQCVHASNAQGLNYNNGQITFGNSRLIVPPKNKDKLIQWLLNQ